MLHSALEILNSISRAVRMGQVSADSLRTRAIPLHALMGRVDARRVCNDKRLSAALSLVTDVHHLNGGRQVTLRSVFSLQVCQGLFGACGCSHLVSLDPW